MSTPEQPSTPRKSTHFRVAAFPASFAIADDVIISDETGRSYLLTHDAAPPTPLGRGEVNALGMFYEPSQDYSWHTIAELRRIMYGEEEATTQMY